MLPASLVGLLPTRKRQVAVVLLGFFAGASIFLGGLLANVPVLAVAAIAALGLLVTVLARRSPLGLLAMFLCYPMVGRRCSN